VLAQLTKQPVAAAVALQQLVALLALQSGQHWLDSATHLAEMARQLAICVITLRTQDAVGGITAWPVASSGLRTGDQTARAERASDYTMRTAVDNTTDAMRCGLCV
jgi:hypothetical protein